MQSRLNLLSSSILRGFQLLFSIVVLGLSATLVEGHNNAWQWETGDKLTRLPTILPLATAIGAVSFVAAILSVVLAWTNLFREYIEMLVDVVVILVNVVGGVTIAIKLRGKNCNDESPENRLGNGEYPYKGSLGSIDILNGGCMLFEIDEYGKQDWGCALTCCDRDYLLNVRCRRSQADSVFMFLTVVVCFAGMLLTLKRMRKNV